MTFDEMLRAACDASPTQIQIPQHWGQGRATFGGLLAACLFDKIQPQVAAGRPVRSLMLSFVAPVAPGILDVQIEVLREGKAATQVQATAVQQDQVCAVMLASFGGDRSSTVSVGALSAPAFKAPEAVSPFPFIAGLTPDFTQHFDYRYTVGKMPFMGGQETRMGGWIRLRDPGEQATSVAELLCLLDAWPPAVFSLLKAPTSGSSLSWTVSFADTPDDCAAGDWWQYLADIQHAANGYSHIDATVWNKHGNAALISRQTVSVFA
ncbi:thioesterase family protein [Pseudomonas sp. J452]|uniref:thioesterase family protein n=1 Tax=Pseudomonas sp. J452 TaxID=2898441 RepID=UPI0021AD883A|nr:thioesterase family protein [Pseudomonas sp. J452]UUY09582.1 thioesterase family protein [Pseudomonas sp. J452]